MEWMAYFDADAFFASVEQAADARLRDRPVAVGGGARGVVCSASYEARAYGVRSAMPVRRALQLCPELCMVRGHYELYEQFSEHVFGLCEDITPSVERGSIDEGVLGLGPRTRSVTEATRLVRGLQEDVRGSLRISLSCGLSVRKQVARIAGKAHKPAGFMLVPRGNEAAYLAPLSARMLPGLGPVATAALEQIGIRRVEDLLRVGPEVLYPLLGARTLGLLELAKGHDDSIVESERPAPLTLGGQQVLDQESGDEGEVEGLLKGLLAAQLERLRAMGKCARTLVVWLRYTDYESARASVSLAEPSQLDPVFLPQIRPLLRRAWQRRVKINQVRVSLERLYPQLLQGDLFDTAGPRSKRLFEAVDALNQRFGGGTLRSASLMGGQLRRRRASGSG